MTSPSPYAPTTVGSAAPSSQRVVTTRSLWWGYAIAPIVPPILSALFVFSVGILSADPNDMGTPIGMVIASITIMTIGAAFSYFLALVIAMPIIFLLRRKDVLNRYTVHLGAVGVSLVLTTISIVIGAATEDSISIQELVLATVITFVMLMALMFPASLVFWWVANLKRTEVAVASDVGFEANGTNFGLNPEPTESPE